MPPREYQSLLKLQQKNGIQKIRRKSTKKMQNMVGIGMNPALLCLCTVSVEK